MLLAFWMAWLRARWTAPYFVPERRIIAEYLTQWSTERLCMLLAHAESGKLAYRSCCCLVGAQTASHALRGRCSSSIDGSWKDWGHLKAARKLPGASAAESAFCVIGNRGDDEERRRIVIPIIRNELARRETLALQAANAATEAPVVTAGKVAAGQI